MVRGEICCPKAYGGHGGHQSQSQSQFPFPFGSRKGRGQQGIPHPTSLLLNICRQCGFCPVKTHLPWEKPSGGFCGLLTVCLA